MFKRLSGTTQQYFKDSIIYLIGKIIPGLVAFFSVPVLIHYFGEAVYGEYSLILSTILLCNTFITGWLNQSFIRFYTDREDKSSFEHFSYKLLLINDLIFILLGDTVLLMTGFSWKFILMCNAILLVLSFMSFFMVEMRTKFKAGKVVLADAMRSGSYLLLVVLLTWSLLNELPIYLLLTANLSAYLIALIILKKEVLALSFYKNIFKYKIKYDDKLRELLSYGLPLSLWFVSSYLLNISDRYVIIYYFDKQSLGEYSAVYDIFSRLMALLFTPIIMALQPIVIKLYNEGDKKKSYFYIRRTVLFELLVFIVLLVMIYFFRDVIVSKFLNLSNPDAVKYVIPIFTGGFLWAISMVIHKPLELATKTKTMLIGVLIALAVNFTGNIFFIPMYGIIAAAYTTIIGSMLYLVYILFMVRNYAKKTE